MAAEMARRFCKLKRAFYDKYDGGAHIQEILPGSGYGRAGRDHVAMLHRFAAANPIYHGRYEEVIKGVPCTVYEGDINQYWIDSMKNPGSAQPFYPTWLLSAYVLALAVKESGCSQVIDVGSGDGRIAFCGRMLGMDACSIEIDGALAGLQRDISERTGVSLDVRCADAAEFDYASLGFDGPAIFTGGLPQMGDVLAATIAQRVHDARMDGCRFILAGSRPRGVGGGNPEWGGWGPLIGRFGMMVEWSMSLPTVWTFDQPQETPYICALLG